MENQLVKINASEYGLEESKAKEIENFFTPMLQKMTELETEFNEISQLEINPDTCKKAHDLRQKYVKVRTGTAEIHKQVKDFYLKGGRFVDGWKNAQLFASEDKESKLSQIVNYYENLEKERITKLTADRTAELLPYSEIIPQGLGEMRTEVWQNYLTGVKVAYQARIDAEAKAEADRIKKEQEEAAERERIRIENERLKAEAIERERVIESERKEAARIQKEKDDAAKVEREKAEAENKRIQDELNKKIESERKEAARIDAENKAAILDAQKAEKAPDKAKLTKWITELTAPDLKLSRPESIKVAGDIEAKLQSFKTWAHSQINTL